jgi:hypothetical protein
MVLQQQERCSMGKVPFDHLGKARQLYRDVEQSLFQAHETLITVHNKWMDRALRHYKGTIRREHFIDAQREIKQAFGPFAFDFESDFRKGYSSISFYHLTPCKIYRADDDDPELQLGVRCAVLDIKKKMEDGSKFLGSYDPVKLSLHAVARWFERNEFKTLEVLLGDLAYLADEASGFAEQRLEFLASNKGSKTFTADFIKFITPTVEVKCPSGGKFIGSHNIEKAFNFYSTDSFRYAKLSSPGRITDTPLSIRTYYSKEMSEDD